MTQPRKEQVKNLKTKYARGPSSVVFGGGPVQNITGADYAAVLAATRTGVDGGAEMSSGAVLTGGVGPYVLAVNSSFSVIMGGVNAGLPVVVTFTAADFIELDANDVMTTSRTAAKINTALAAHGVTVPVAQNVDGRLVLRSANSSGYTYGDDSYISLSDVTPGTLTVLGLSVTNQATAAGTTAPERGIITSSQDGLGGWVQIRNLDSTPSEPQNPAMIHVAPYRYTPEIPPGRPAYGRIRKMAVGGPGLEITYYRTGFVRPSVVTSLSDFSTLELTDTLDVTINFGNGTTVTFTLSLEDVATVAQVVDAINLAYRNATAALTNGTEFTRASVPVPLPGPYVFSDPAKRDSFFISFNGNTAIHINPPAGEYSAATFATYINSRISAAGQFAEGEAVALTLTPGDAVRTVIRSKNMVGSSSSVAFLPGNPGGSTPGGFLETLNALGVTPGLYKATYVARVYGLDEIEFFCPSTLQGASLTLTPSSTGSGAKWGVPAAVTKTVTLGPTPVPVPTAYVIIPEMVEFHEEPDDYDTVIQDFENRSDTADLNPADGIGNIGLQALLGQTGKIDPSFIPRFLESLSLNQVSLGSNLTKSATDQLSPRTAVPYNPTFGAVLVWQGVDVTAPSSGGLIRVYLKEGDVYLTRNAKLNSAGNWERDVLQYSTMFEFSSGRTSLSIYNPMSSAPWAHSSWQRNVQLNPFLSSSGSYREGLLSLGEFANVGSQASQPRVDVPVQLETPTLLFAAKGPTGIVVRAYVSVDNLAAKSYLEVTVNANFNGAQYSKDVTGKVAVRYKFSNSAGIEMSTRLAANDAAWSAWDQTGLRIDPVTMTSFLGGTVRPGDSLTDGTVPRVVANRGPSASYRRTLLFESPIADAGTFTVIRLYIDTSYTNLGEGFTFTWNAKWDQSISRFVQDVPAQKSYAWSMIQGRFWFFTKAAGAVPWDDSFVHWDTYDAFDRGSGGAYDGMVVKDGTFRVDSPGAVSNPASSAVVLLNAVYAKSMVKAWGRGTYQTGNLAIWDGYNFAWQGANAFAWDSGFSTAITTSRAVVQTVENGSNTGFAVSGPANANLGLVFTSARFISYFLDYAGSLYPQANYATMSWVVFAAT
jgi:hypothetical protein